MKKILAFAAMAALVLVTSCVIPILVLLFFFWVIKQLTGVDPGYLLPGRRDARKESVRL